MADTIAPVARLSRLSPLSAETRRHIAASCTRPVTTSSHHVVHIDEDGATPRYILSGWAARYHLNRKGERQLLNLVLPGDVIHPVDHGAPALMALTDVRTCEVVQQTNGGDLASALERSRELDQSYLFSQVARLGSMNAQERLVDLVAEIFERLLLANLAKDGQIAMPLTQAQLAELLAMTPVHANRMIRIVRDDERQFRWSGKIITIAPDSEVHQRIQRNLATIARANPDLHRL